MAAKQPTDLNKAVTTDEVIDDLAGVVKLAEMLGVTRSSIYRYIARDDFPVPIVALKRSRAWSWKEVAEWAKRTLPADNLWRETGILLLAQQLLRHESRQRRTTCIRAARTWRMR
jgi:predicted DNA-binding transcriptional regulator AlpA